MRNLSSELERETAGAADLKREFGDAARALREGADAIKGDLRKLGDAAAGPNEPPKP